MSKVNKITLSDCLACSGCITSAESVLITQQSQEEMIKVFEEVKTLHFNGESEKAKIIVVTLSSQPILSMAAKFNLDPQQTAAKLCGKYLILVILERVGH